MDARAKILKPLWCKTKVFVVDCTAKLNSKSKYKVSSVEVDHHKASPPIHPFHKGIIARASLQSIKLITEQDNSSSKSIPNRPLEHQSHNCRARMVTSCIAFHCRHRHLHMFSIQSIVIGHWSTHHINQQECHASATCSVQIIIISWNAQIRPLEHQAIVIPGLDDHTLCSRLGILQG